MPGPTTEVLNEDIKELKGEIRDIRSDLDVLKADVHAIAVGLAELRAEFRVSVEVAKWAIGALTTVLLGSVLSGVITGVWWASNITAEVRHLTYAIEQQKPATPPAPATKVATGEPEGTAK